VTARRLGSLLAIAWLVGLAMPGTAAAASEKDIYRFAPVPDWVDRQEPDYQSPVPAGGGVDGEYYLLIDRQVQVGPAGDDLYRHIAVKVLDASGVDGNSQFDFGVD